MNDAPHHAPESSPPAWPVAPIRAWQASLLTLLFALAPAPLIALIAAAIGKLRGQTFQQAQEQTIGMPAVFALISVLSVIPALWLVRQPLPRAPWRQAFALHAVPWRVIAIAIVTGVALQLPLSEISNLVELIAPVDPAHKLAMAKLLNPSSLSATLQLVLSVVIAAPVCEELLFRGALLPGLRRAHGTFAALGLSAALFGAAHANLITAVLPAALAGLAFGVVALRFGSILPSIALHAAVNAMPVFVTGARVPIVGFNVLDERVRHVPLVWLLPSCVIAAVGLCWLYRAGGMSVDGDGASADGADNDSSAL